MAEQKRLRRRAEDQVDEDRLVEQLRQENDRLREQLAGVMTPEPAQSHTTLYVGAIIWLSALAVISIVVITVRKPDDMKTPTMILGFILPITTAFMAAALQQIHMAVNGRLTQLLALTAKSSMAEGRLAGHDVER